MGGKNGDIRLIFDKSHMPDTDKVHSTKLRGKKKGRKSDER